MTYQPAPIFLLLCSIKVWFTLSCIAHRPITSNAFSRYYSAHSILGSTHSYPKDHEL